MSKAPGILVHHFIKAVQTLWHSLGLLKTKLNLFFYIALLGIEVCPLIQIQKENIKFVFIFISGQRVPKNKKDSQEDMVETLQKDYNHHCGNSPLNHHHSFKYKCNTNLTLTLFLPIPSSYQ